ncbi:MAG: DUF401 family protein [Gudongella sp.]|jgi:integral membrane protein (TIGR00529 family)|nr:DUF401 family protein [Gudongella sp.]
MNQLLVILAAFALIPFLIKKKLDLSKAIFIVSIVIAIFTKIGLGGFFRTIINTFSDAGASDTVLTVALVSVLGGLMKRYGILDRIVETMLKIISNKKLVMMIIPSMIGILVVPGGAVLSAPFINSLGEETGIPSTKRAAVNLVFRHISMFLFPFSTALLFIKASMPDINIYKVIGFSIPFVIGMVFLGYTMYLKGAGNGTKVHSEGRAKNLIKLLVLTSPIYISVVINVITGLPFFVSMFGSLIAVYFIGNRKDFLKNMGDSLNINTILVVAAILLLKDIILQLDEMLILIKGILVSAGSGIGILLVFTVVSFFFGYITGYPTSALAVTLPLLSMMDMSVNAVHIYAFFLFAVAFMGYYYSPLHLCQVLTIGEMEIGTFDLYKEYKLYALLQLLLIYAATLIMLAIFA